MGFARNMLIYIATFTQIQQMFSLFGIKKQKLEFTMKDCGEFQSITLPKHFALLHHFQQPFLDYPTHNTESGLGSCCQIGFKTFMCQLLGRDYFSST